MVQSNYKLCWLHSEYNLNFGADKCTTGVNFPANEESIPQCHLDCNIYAQCKRAFELAGLPNNCWHPPANIKVYAEDVNAMATTQHIRRNIYSFVKNGQNLWMYSTVSGNGKTYRATTLACTYILNNVLKENYFDNMVRYVYFPKYIADFEIMEKYSFENERRNRFFENLESLYTSDLVIWDDFGYGSDSRIETTILRAIINDRVNNGKSNIFISNKSLQEISPLIGRTMYTRIVDSSLLVEFRGLDLRSDSVYTC